MTNYFYFDANGQKHGPINGHQLQALATQGIVTPETPIETDSGQRGTAGQISGLKFGPAMPPSFAQTPPPNAAFPQPTPNTTYAQPTGPETETIETPITKMVESGLKLSCIFDDKPGMFAAFQRNMSKLLTWSVLVGCLSLGLFFTVLSIKSDTLSFMYAAAGVSLAGIVLHFLCSRFSYAGTCLVAATPCRISTGGLTECLGLFALLVALGGFFFGIYSGIKMEDWITAMGGFLLFFSYGFIMLCCLNPRACLNLQFSDDIGASAGETALSLWYVIIRLSLISVPVGFALLAVGGTVTAWWAILKLLGGSSDGDYGAFEVFMQASQLGATSAGCLVLAGIGPLLTYVGYLLLSLMAEVCRAVFEIARNTQKS